MAIDPARVAPIIAFNPFEALDSVNPPEALDVRAIVTSMARHPLIALTVLGRSRDPVSWD